MKILSNILPLLYTVHLVIGTSDRTFKWTYDATGIDQLYSPSLLMSTKATLIACIGLCSDTVNCQAATYNNMTGDCSCLENTTNAMSELGNRLWNRLIERRFDDFIYNENLGWYIRIFSNEIITQAEAKTFCGDIGARLAVPDTEDKINFIIRQPDYLSHRVYFVGATDEDSDGIFQWSTGSNVTNFKTGEPNGFYMGEECVAIFQSGLADFSCSHLGGLVCEIE